MNLVSLVCTGFIQPGHKLNLLLKIHDGSRTRHATDFISLCPSLVGSSVFYYFSKLSGTEMAAQPVTAVCLSGLMGLKRDTDNRKHFHMGSLQIKAGHKGFVLLLL